MNAKKKFLIITSFLFSSLLFAERPIVQNILATTGKGRIINVSWTLPENPDKKISELQIFKSKKQISSFFEIENLSPIAKISPTLTSYQDSVDDFSDYYYAVICVTDKPYEIIILSVNSTVKGVHLMPKKTEEEKSQNEEETFANGELRKTPLPYINIIDGMNEDDLISEETLDSTKGLTFSKDKKSENLKPYIFEEDLVSPDGGEEYILFEILKNYFASKKYEQAIFNLQKLNGTNISSKTQNRCIFYIGEAYYFLEKYDDAIRYFIQVKKTYPRETQLWIDSSLDKM